ncbi:MAG: class I SAM-dependent methyltransferase [Bradyrhizobium sp.]
MKEFDHYRDGYSQKINQAIAFSGQTQDFYTEVKARCLLDVLSRLRAPGSASDAAAFGAGPPLKVLDVGCGQGLIHPHLHPSKANLKLTGVDVAGTVIDEAREANPHVHYDVYNGEQLPYSDNTYDAAYAIAVMHHVPPANWTSFLKEMMRVVRPGGMIAIIEHNPINPLTQWIVKSCPFDENAVLLRSGRLAGLFRAAGLVEMERRFIIFTPFDSAFFRQLDSGLSWLPLGAQYCMVARVPS